LILIGSVKGPALVLAAKLVVAAPIRITDECARPVEERRMADVCGGLAFARMAWRAPLQALRGERLSPYRVRVHDNVLYAADAQDRDPAVRSERAVPVARTEVVSKIIFFLFFKRNGCVCACWKKFALFHVVRGDFGRSVGRRCLIKSLALLAVRAAVKRRPGKAIRLRAHLSRFRQE
jgi:hypothetical protein